MHLIHRVCERRARLRHFSLQRLQSQDGGRCDVTNHFDDRIVALHERARAG